MRRSARLQAATHATGGKTWRLAAVTGLCVVPVGLLLLPTTLLLAVGMVPTLVALIVDRSREKLVVLVVGSLNFTGIMPSAMTLWQNDHTLAAALRILGDPVNWLLMYGAAGLGWLIYFSVPPLVAELASLHYQREIERHKQRQAALVKEWGQEIDDDGTGPA